MDYILKLFLYTEIFFKCIFKNYKKSKDILTQILTVFFFVITGFFIKAGRCNDTVHTQHEHENLKSFSYHIDFDENL